MSEKIVTIKGREVRLSVVDGAIVVRTAFVEGDEPREQDYAEALDEAATRFGLWASVHDWPEGQKHAGVEEWQPKLLPVQPEHWLTINGLRESVVPVDDHGSPCALAAVGANCFLATRGSWDRSSDAPYEFVKDQLRYAGGPEVEGRWSISGPLLRRYEYWIGDTVDPTVRWPDEGEIEVDEAELAEGETAQSRALADLREKIVNEIKGLDWRSGYEVGTVITGHLLESDSEIARVNVVLDAADAGADKAHVDTWHDAASYVVVGADGRAYDASAEVGEHARAWFIRTSDTGDGPDCGPDDAFETREDAEKAARKLAEKLDEGEGAKSAEEYERRRVDDAAAVAFETDEGQFCVYWRSTDEYDGPRQRYATLEDAKAVAAKSQREFEERHPGGSALCRFEVRVLDDNGEWVECRGGR